MFDKTRKNRKGIFDSIPKLIQFNKIYYEEKISTEYLFEDKDHAENETFDLSTGEK